MALVIIKEQIMEIEVIYLSDVHDLLLGLS